MPEDDDMSEDEFEGYLDDDLINGDDETRTPTDDLAHSENSSTYTDDDAGCQTIPDFEQPGGCAEDMTGASPLQFFQQMVTTEMLEQIVEQTNLYAQQLYVTGFGKIRHMGFFVKIKFDVYLISSTLELTYLQV